MLSRNPLASVNRWAVSNGRALMRDYDGRVFMFLSRRSAEEALEFWRVAHDTNNDRGFRAVPLPFTPNGKDYAEMYKVLMHIALTGDESNFAAFHAKATFAKAIIGGTKEAYGRMQECAQQLIQELKDQGHDPWLFSEADRGS